jgi:hypothetical protein
MNSQYQYAFERNALSAIEGAINAFYWARLRELQELSPTKRNRNIVETTAQKRDGTVRVRLRLHPSQMANEAGRLRRQWYGGTYSYVWISSPLELPAMFMLVQQAIENATQKRIGHRTSSIPSATFSCAVAAQPLP